MTDNELSPDLGCGIFANSDREFFLGLYRAAVNFFQPRIEKRTEIRLGDVAVWDYDWLGRHATEEYDRRMSAWPPEILKRFIVRRRVRRFLPSIEEALKNRARQHAACYFRDAIYVSFESGTTHEEAIAAVTIHELSHALWERIEGRRLDERRKGLDAQDAEKLALFVEGFATYAEHVWFRDLYPGNDRHLDVLLTLPPGSVYLRGLRRIERLVKEHGSEILIEVPKRWRLL